ncbi:unnamed protein product [Vicia faba]|uniref:Uncharacterized protein n=1 Tax=Vicia faba TaxID=3906 RepID=A0AAV0ZZK9_VICFA|nr:unnamed protein product [Vicia faba]
MWRSIPIRQRCAILRNFNTVHASPIQVPLYNLAINPTQSTISSFLDSPQFSNSINNPRFLSQQIATEKEVPIDSHPSENHIDDVRLETDDFAVSNDDDNNEHGFGLEEEETLIFQINDKKLEKVVSLLHSSGESFSKICLEDSVASDDTLYESANYSSRAIKYSFTDNISVSSSYRALLLLEEPQLFKSPKIRNTQKNSVSFSSSCLGSSNKLAKENSSSNHDLLRKSFTKDELMRSSLRSSKVFPGLTESLATSI